MVPQGFGLPARLLPVATTGGIVSGMKFYLFKLMGDDLMKAICTDPAGRGLPRASTPWTRYKGSGELMEYVQAVSDEIQAGTGRSRLLSDFWAVFYRSVSAHFALRGRRRPTSRERP